MKDETSSLSTPSAIEAWMNFIRSVHHTLFRMAFPCASQSRYKKKLSNKIFLMFFLYCYEVCTIIWTKINHFWTFTEMNMRLYLFHTAHDFFCEEKSCAKWENELFPWNLWQKDRGNDSWVNFMWKFWGGKK